MAAVRYKTIDAMRGLAAAAVLVGHLGPALGGSVGSHLHLGTSAVWVFFVISGFVIAATVSTRAVTPAFAGRFAIRRSIRLDIPYWIALAAAVLLGHQTYTAGAFLANMFYVYQLTHSRGILIVQWTLVLEVQLYALFVACVGVSQWIARRFQVNELKVLLLPTVAAATILGALDRTTDLFSQWCVLKYWFQFTTGALCYWIAAGRVPWKVGLLYLLFLPYFDRTGRTMHIDLPAIVVAGTALFLILGRRSLTTMGSSPVLQWLGRISYSLYLTHFIAIQALDRFEWVAILPPVALVIVKAILCLFVAWVFYLGPEKLSLWLSQKVKMPAEPRGNVSG